MPRAFYQSVIVAALNPKSALFFVAFLPQFVDAPNAVWEQTLLLGTVFALLIAAVDVGYALIAGSAGQWLRRSRGFRVSQRYVSGVVYLAMGTAAAISGEGK